MKVKLDKAKKKNTYYMGSIISTLTLVTVFLHLTLPKAGTKIGSIPLYVADIVLIILYALTLFTTLKAKKLIIDKVTFWPFSLWLLLVVIICIQAIVYGISFDWWFVATISVFFLYPWSMIIGAKYNVKVLSRCILFAFILVTAYGAAQKLFGDYTLLLPGITANFAESQIPGFLAEKYNLIQNLNYLKLTSTYQNGNLFGVNYILITWGAIGHLIANKRVLIAAIALIAATSVIILTASVTVYFGFTISVIVFFGISLLRRNLNKSFALYFFAIILVLSIVTFFNEGNIASFLFKIFSERIASRDLLQMGGRAESFKMIEEYIMADGLRFLPELIFGNLRSMFFGELTYFALIDAFGMIFTAYFLFIIIKHISNKKYYSGSVTKYYYLIGILGYLAAAGIDGALWFPPTAFNLFLFIGLIINPDGNFTIQSQTGNNELKQASTDFKQNSCNLFFDARFIDTPAGVGRYSREILTRLYLLQNQTTFYLAGYPNKIRNFCKENHWLQSRYCIVPYRYSMYSIRSLLFGYSMIQKLKSICDVFYYPHYTAPPNTPKNKSIITIFDLIQYKYHYGNPLINRLGYYFVKAIARNSCKIITSSQHSKEDIIKMLSVNPSKVVVIYLSSHIKERVRSRKDKRFFLYVGNHKPHKNLGRALLAFKRFKENSKYQDYQFILIGEKFDKNNEVTFFQATHPNIKIDIQGHKHDSELEKLYKTATALVFISLYEGFGLPPLEAMSLGCPVICSNTSSLPEVCGNAAIYVDPYDVEQVATAMQTVASNEHLRRRLIAKGYENVKRFSWDRTATEVNDVINTIKN